MICGYHAWIFWLPCHPCSSVLQAKSVAFVHLSNTEQVQYKLLRVKLTFALVKAKQFSSDRR